MDGGQLGSAGAGTTGGAEAGAPAHPAPDVGRVAPPGDGHPAGGAETGALARTPGVSVIAGGGGNGGAGIGPGGAGGAGTGGPGGGSGGLGTGGVGGPG
ncbi:hypothetical protein DLJ58_06400, partial [Micromonospora arida]